MKRIRRIIVVFLCISLFTLPADDEVFAPFVSRLKVVPEGSQVHLTWNDSVDVQGRYLIYRYTEEITETNFRLAEKVGIVPEGREFFRDTPPEFGKPYYYAVLAETGGGELFELFIPFRNKTVYAVSIEKTPEITDIAASITSIEAEGLEDFIRLRYEADKKARELSVYRNISPIRGREDILDADLIALISSTDSEFRDFTIPGIPYYYGIIDSELAKTGTYAFTPGQNATTEGAEIPLSSNIKTESVLRSRPRPLPMLTIHSTLFTGENLIVSPLPSRALSPISREIINIVKHLAGSTLTENPLPGKGEILETDRLRLANGDSYNLGRIIETTLLKGNWEEAEQRLLLFRRTRREGDEDLRSHFYLGQVYFFQEKYREAFYEFLLTREAFRQQTEPWLDAVLAALK